MADILTNIFIWANLVIGIFNVLPGLPLDGGRLVESAVWKATGSQAKGTVAAGWGGRVIVVALGLWFVALPLLRRRQRRTPASCSSPSWSADSSGWGRPRRIQQGRLRSRLHLVSAAALAEPAVGIPDSATVADILRLTADGGPPSCSAGRTAGPQGVVDRRSPGRGSCAAAACHHPGQRGSPRSRGRAPTCPNGPRARN